MASEMQKWQKEVAKMAREVSDLVEGMDPRNTVVVIQALDNSTYYCGKDFGEMPLPKKGKDNKLPRRWRAQARQEAAAQRAVHTDP